MPEVDFEGELLTLLQHCNNSINSLVNIAKLYTPTEKDLEPLKNDMHAYNKQLVNIYQLLDEKGESFPDANIPEFIIQSLEEKINLDIPSYNVYRDLDSHLKLTEEKIVSYDKYGIALEEYLKKIRNKV